MTLPGGQIWDLGGRLGGQTRTLPGAVIGWDMAAAFDLARALDVPVAAVAELLPALEAIMVRKINEQLSIKQSAP